MSHRTPVLLGAALLLIAVNLRLPLTAVPPVLDDVRSALGLSSAATGLLTTLPVLCFAAAASVAPGLARRFGGELVLLGCVLAIAAGTAVRIVPTVIPLFAGTLIIGVGIALANVLLPATIKRDFVRPGTMMGLYIMLLNGGAALGAGLTVPLEHTLGDWRWALAVGGVPAVLAAILWLPAVLHARRWAADAPRARRVSLWRDRTSWKILALMGIQSSLFYSMVAWVPDILRETGMSAGTAGFMLSIAMLLGLPTSMIFPMLAGRMNDQRPLVAIAAALWAMGLLGLLLSPGTAPAVWMVILGLGQGAGIGLALTLIVVRAPDGDHAAALSGMVQTGGYAIGAAGPLIIGVVHDLSGGWTEPLLVMMAATVGMVVFGMGAGRPGMVRGRVDGDPQWAY
jgi:CP family cyanate transporter-like MFS transporter